jgi:hypothetical protein
MNFCFDVCVLDENMTRSLHVCFIGTVASEVCKCSVKGGRLCNIDKVARVVRGLLSILNEHTSIESTACSQQESRTNLRSCIVRTPTTKNVTRP